MLLRQTRMSLQNIFLVILVFIGIIIIKKNTSEMAMFTSLNNDHAYSHLTKEYHYDDDEFIIHEYFIGPERAYKTHDVLILSQGDLNKVEENIYNLCNIWNGPLNIAVYNFEHNIAQTLCFLTNLRNCNPCLKKHVSFHLVTKSTKEQTESNLFRDSCDAKCNKTFTYPEKIDKPPSPIMYPNNMLRNVARRTSFLTWEFMIDIDMVPSPALRNAFINMIGNKKKDSRFRPENKQVFVIPAFEVKTGTATPKTRSELISRYNKGDDVGDVQPFHNWCEVCYRKSQNYAHWINLDAEARNPETGIADRNHEKYVNDLECDFAYRLQYHLPFEPYYIVGTRADAPKYDERFRGYGYNKVSQCYEMSLRKWEFVTLDSQYICHLGWKSATSNSTKKTNEQAINTIKFKEFSKNLKNEIARGH